MYCFQFTLFKNKNRNVEFANDLRAYIRTA